MTVQTHDMARTIYEQTRSLPPESLADLAKYVEFLKFKAVSDTSEQAEPVDNPLIRLEGILAGYDFSPDVLAAARRELWQGFGERSL